jgi:hypothetical protein
MQLLAAYSALSAAGQKHYQGDARPDPDRALNRNVHMVLLSLHVWRLGAAPSGPAAARDYRDTRFDRRRFRKMKRVPPAPSQIAA